MKVVSCWQMAGYFKTAHVHIPARISTRERVVVLSSKLERAGVFHAGGPGGRAACVER